jgi:translation initiation factor 3 subunit C
MSRFFQGSDSDTETSSSSDEDIYSEHDDEEQLDGDSDLGEEDESEAEESSDNDDDPAARRNKFLRGAVASDESDEDEGKRVVKSAKDKRLQEIEATSKAIENGGKINDWAVISNGYISFKRNINVRV